MSTEKSPQENHPLPYRILHEVIMSSIFVLMISGMYIHRPFLSDGGGFLMSLMRGSHFFFTILLIIAVTVRFASMFIGKNADWRCFFPTINDIKRIPAFLLYYLRLGKHPENNKKYNPMQMTSYYFVFLLVILQIITGFILLFPDWGILGWINYTIFNNEVNVRITHYIATWLFVLFVLIHVYLSIREAFSEIKVMHLLRDSDKESRAGD